MSVLKDYLDLRFQSFREQVMSEFSDKIAAVQNSADNSIARVEGDVRDLQTQIDELKGRVSTPEDMAALDKIQAKLDALDPVKPATLPEGETPPTPPTV
jgi:hypothetical protein